MQKNQFFHIHINPLNEYFVTSSNRMQLNYRQRLENSLENKLIMQKV